MTGPTPSSRGGSHCRTAAILCTCHTSREWEQPNSALTGDLASGLLPYADGIVRRYRPEYEALKAQLIEACGDDEWRAVLDVFVERVIDQIANTSRQDRRSKVARFAASELARTRKSLNGHEDRSDRVLATVLFTDIVDSTRHAAELGDRSWMELLERHDEIIRAEIARFHGRVVRHTGDGAVAVFDGPSRAVLSAATIAECLSELGVQIRSGLHTGECEFHGDDIGGIAVHTGSRIADVARAGEVLVSSTVKDLVNGSGIAFQDRGVYALKGVPGAWRLFSCS